MHLSEIPELVPLHESHFATCGNRPEVFCVLGNVDPSGDISFNEPYEVPGAQPGAKVVSLLQTNPRTFSVCTRPQGTKKLQCIALESDALGGFSRVEGQDVGVDM